MLRVLACLISIGKELEMMRAWRQLGPTYPVASERPRDSNSRRIAHRFSDSRDTLSLWKGIQTITDYKPPPQTCDSTIPLLNELNAFFARFEAQNSTTAQKTPPPPGDQVMTLSPDSVRRSLSRINARKAPGPDNIPGCVLRDCAVELTDVFRDIFNISLNQAVVPTCFKAATIIPVPKKSSPSCFNDYCPVALTPIVMKCFERLVMQHIKSVLPPSLDPFQFAYRSNRLTDDAIATALHPTLTHLDKKDSYVRLLFIDFSSAFNTIIPQQLTHKLVQLGLNTSLCNWLLDFLTGRPQAVRVGINTSSTITLNTGPPEDVCWAPFSSLCWPTTAHRHTTLTFSLSLRMTWLWCVSLATELRQTTGVRWAAWPGGAVTTISQNVEKMKEIVVDFRRVHTQHAPLTINGATVERVSSTKFLGVHITEDLSWTNNTAALARKAQQRLYYSSANSRARAPPIMCTFYKGTIESILTRLHHCVVWRLQRILPQVTSTHSESSWEDRWCLSPLPPGHLQHPSHPQSPLHCRWSHPPDTQLLQSAAIREETAESPGEDQQTEGQLHTSGCQEAELPPVLAPLPSFTPHNTEPWHYNPPPPSFSTMSSFVYLYSLYVHMFKLYLSVFGCLLSVFNVNCMHQGSESNAISILCMYVQYMWKIDNKADLTWLDY